MAPDVEVILVDNGSTDTTMEVLQDLLPLYSGIRSIRVNVNRGYGFGIISGLKASKGKILGWTHADLQTDPNDAIRALAFFEKFGPDCFVKGRRYGRPFSDVAFTTCMSIFETALLMRPMWDINAQPTLLSRKNFESWVDPPTDFSLDLYAYYCARIRNQKVLRFPVKFGERIHGVSHWNVDWKAKQKFIRRTIDFSFQLKDKISK